MPTPPLLDKIRRRLYPPYLAWHAQRPLFYFPQYQIGSERFLSPKMRTSSNYTNQSPLRMFVLQGF